MARNRPTFPVIRYIKGIEEWSKSPDAYNLELPGLKKSQNEILIEFSESTSNPLFRFCLELFSIIPEKCIDKVTDKLICEKTSIIWPIYSQ